MRHATSVVSIVALVLGLGVAACGKKGESMDPLVKETMAKLTEARDKGCACANLECVAKVQNDLGHWMLDNAKRLEELNTKATPKQNEAGQKLSAELDVCAKKLEAAGKTAPP
ncbi:MAG TPA: hypothetical protein VM261_23215 [Kofleriaceae bacterium]|nr:hypothetical protein [Kofleriaceae bacterium]